MLRAISIISILFLILGSLCGICVWFFFGKGGDKLKPITAKDYCPGNGMDNHGSWKLDDKEGLRCILKCRDGYEPSACHVIRKDKEGKWKDAVPTCAEVSWISRRRLACYTGAALVVISSPSLIYQLGFSSVGVVKGSIAAMLQGPTIAAGSWFAKFQSIGMTGLKKRAALELIEKIGEACDGLASLFYSCEEE